MEHLSTDSEYNEGWQFQVPTQKTCFVLILQQFETIQIVSKEISSQDMS